MGKEAGIVLALSRNAIIAIEAAVVLIVAGVAVGVVLYDGDKEEPAEEMPKEFTVYITIDAKLFIRCGDGMLKDTTTVRISCLGEDIVSGTWGNSANGSRRSDCSEDYKITYDDIVYNRVIVRDNSTLYLDGVEVSCKFVIL